MNAAEGTVLVVDDRPASRYTVVHALKRAGFNVLEASTGIEALELSTQLPAVIVLDVRLPDILGYEVCRRIKANKSTSHILVLQLSAAFLSDESKVHALESGADSFLTPPVEPNVLVATVRSLVRLHDAELRNRLLGQQWQTTFDALSEGVAHVDLSGTIHRSNRAMSTILNRQYSVIEGQSLVNLIQQHFGKDIEGRVRFQEEEVQLGSRYFRLSLSPIERNGTPEGSVFIISEITEQKLAQLGFLVNERLAATGRIANIIAHEINNPLEAITNLLYLLEGDKDLSSASSEYLTLAQGELSRVSRITRQILTFNRESAKPIPIPLFQLLEDVLVLNNRAILEKSLTVVKDWDETIVVHGFPAQLRQVFSNLLRNAIEASQGGSQVRLRLSLTSRWGKSREPSARVSFADHGMGIPKENRERVFDAFFTTKELRGSGIGLWLSSKIVKEHHGLLQVRSSTAVPTSGTCVSVLLPLDYTSGSTS